MKSLALPAAVALIAMAGGGCALTGTPPPQVTPAMVGAGGGASADTLNQGRHIFTQPCTSCHEADPLGNHSMPEWRSIVSEMAPKAKLDPARRAALLAYIGAAKAVGPTATPH